MASKVLNRYTPLRWPVLVAQPNVAAASTTARPRCNAAALACGSIAGSLLRRPTTRMPTPPR
jgi:hypothetical protein